MPKIKIPPALFIITNAADPPSWATTALVVYSQSPRHTNAIEPGNYKITDGTLLLCLEQKTNYKNDSKVPILSDNIYCGQQNPKFESIKSMLKKIVTTRGEVNAMQENVFNFKQPNDWKPSSSLYFELEIIHQSAATFVLLFTSFAITFQLVFTQDRLCMYSHQFQFHH